MPPPAAPAVSGCWQITGTGSAFTGQAEYSQPIDVAPGLTYTFTGSEQRPAYNRAGGVTATPAGMP